jgi:hypothetical protein
LAQPVQLVKIAHGGIDMVLSFRLCATGVMDDPYQWRNMVFKFRLCPIGVFHRQRSEVLTDAIGAAAELSPSRL